jgi:hypothetical protein
MIPVSFRLDESGSPAKRVEGFFLAQPRAGIERVGGC